MTNDQRSADIETLARMAARLAGKDPDQHVHLTLGDIVGFNDVMWRYPDFIARAHQAYELLV